MSSNRKQWKHKSVRALLRKSGSADPITVIRSKAKEMVSWAKEKHWCGPPYNPLEIASLLGIRARKSEELFSAEAQLTPIDGHQLLLEFNPSRSTGRKNFSISHELVHTFFDDCFQMVHQRRENRSTFDPDAEVELLCQIGAAEILMPEEDFLADLAHHPLSLATVPFLSQRYEASREAVARRMISLAGKRAALVFLSRRLKPVEQKSESPNGSPPTPKMRILYSVTGEDFPIFLPAHKSVPDSSCVYKAHIVDEVVTAREQWELVDFGNWTVESMALPVPDEQNAFAPEVMALVQTA